VYSRFVDIARTLRTSDGTTLAYRLWRPGRPRLLIVLVHGLASNHTRWAEFVRTTRLRESWDLLRPDLRGFEGSRCRGRVGLEEWARDLTALIAAEGVSRAVVVGHCLGANVALHFADRNPAAVQGLVLIEPMFREALTGTLRLATRLRLPVAGLATMVRGLNAVGLHRRRLQSLDLEQLDREARAAMAGPGGFPEDRYASPLEDLKYAPTAVYLAGLLAVTGPLPALSKIEAPSLALLSSGGQYGDPAVTARLLGELPRGETRRLEARHWIPTECPAEMRQAIELWCDRLTAPERQEPSDP
jgi:pimeloyl-ACP methyl ester carboxylesterase